MKDKTTEVNKKKSTNLVEETTKKKKKKIVVEWFSNYEPEKTEENK
ncbi:MAG: hypothetical protein IIT46_00185 [Lachnospiraceae bacterium]|nr:hypothetical protein [Lachnospiraceae bacterium]